MSVTVDELITNLNAEDSERPFLENVILPQAEAYVNKFINRKGFELSEDEEVIKDRCILFMASSFYLDRDGSGSTQSNSYAGLKILTESLRKPSVGFDVGSNSNG